MKTKKTFRLREAAAYLGINIYTLRTWVARKRIPALKGPGPRDHYFWTEAMLKKIARGFERLR